MKLDDLEPLPEDMLRLLRLGRPGTEPPPAAREAALSFVAVHGVAAGAALAAHGATASTRGMRALKAWSSLKGSFGVGGIVLGAALGAGGHAAYVARHEVRPAASSEAPASMASAASEGTRLPSAASESSAPVMIESPVPAVAQASRGRADDVSPKNARDTSLGAERTLIDTARTAVARGDGQAALATLDRHLHDFPHGRLAEEREWLAIQALVLSGRGDDAHARATVFRRSFPQSLMLPALDQIVTPKSAP